MAGILQYKNPQAQVLYGAGNPKIDARTIASYINQPGMTADKIREAAVANNVSVDQISSAMSSNKDFSSANIDKYLTGQGITRETVEPEKPKPVLQMVQQPTPVTAQPITIDSKDTVAGQLSDFTQNRNNPINVQAETFANQATNKRGLLNSSIGVSAVQDAVMRNAMPIAQQDAGTNFAAKQQNASNKLQADIFSGDRSSRIDMFNAGNEKDVLINRENLDMNEFIAKLDTSNKLAIANIQAMAQDSGIMGDLGKSFMALYQQTASDPNIKAEQKAEIFNTLKTQFENMTGLLPSFEKAGKNLNFGADAANTTGTAFAPNKAASTSTATSPTASKYNIYGYQVEPDTMQRVYAYEKTTGQQVDKSKVVPQQIINDILSGYNQHSQESMAKLKQYVDAGVVTYNKKSFDAKFVPVHPPGTMRADNPMFYVYAE